MNAESKDRFLTVNELAAKLKLCPKTVQTMCRKGRLPGAKIGKSWRFSILDLKNWHAGLKRKGKPMPHNRDAKRRRKGKKSHEG